MKTKLITSLLVFILICSVKAQDKKTSFQIGKKESIIEVVKVENKGFIIKTGKNRRYSANTKKVNWHLRYYDLDLNLIWDKSIRKKKVDARYGDVIFGNISGKKIYHIEKINKAKGNIISQILMDGTVNNNQIKKTKWETLSKYNLVREIATDSLFCFIIKKHSYEEFSSKKLKNKMILFKVFDENFKTKKINLKLPQLSTKPKNTSFWYYETHDEEGIYFTSVFDDNKGKDVDFTYSSVKMDYNGVLLKEMQIAFKRENIAKVNQWEIKLDLENSFIYICGLEQLKLNVKENDQRNLFIKKYDFEGNLIWENKIEGISAGNGYLPVSLIIQENEDVHLELQGRNILAIWEYNSKGKFIKNYSTNLEEIVRVKGDYIPTEGTPSYNYFKKCRSREHMYYSCSLTSSMDKGVLIEHNDETGNVDVLLFSK